MSTRPIRDDIDRIMRPYQADYSSGELGRMKMSPPSYHVTADAALAYLQRQMDRHPEGFFGHVGRRGETIATVTGEGVLRSDTTRDAGHDHVHADAEGVEIEP